MFSTGALAEAAWSAAGVAVAVLALFLVCIVIVGAIDSWNNRR